MAEGRSHVRFFNAIPDEKSVDIYVNGKLLVDDLTYKNFTEFDEAYPGSFRVEVYVHGYESSPVISEIVELKDKVIYTVSVVGKMPLISLDLVEETYLNVDPNKTYIRFVNYSPVDTKFDVYINTSEAVQKLDYLETSHYTVLDPEAYNIKIYNYVTGDLKLEDPRAVLKKGKIYTGYIVGYENKKPGLEIIIALEGKTYINIK